MLAHAAKAVPWLRIAVAAGLVVVLMELVRWQPWLLWPLEGTAVGLLAGAAAWCFDEPAAAIVDAAPRGLAWRTCARALGTLPLALAWTFAVWHGRDALFGHPWVVVLQGAVAVAVGAAWTQWRRSGGDATPGLLLATIVIPASTAWALVRPVARHIPVFPYGFEGWRAGSVFWLTAGAVSIAVLAVVLADARWWRLRVTRSGSGPLPPHPIHGTPRPSE